MSDTTGVANEQGAGIPPIGETFNESTVFPDEVTLRPTRRFTKRGTPLGLSPFGAQQSGFVTCTVGREKPWHQDKASLTST